MNERIEAANRVLSSFSPATIVHHRGVGAGWYVTWPSSAGKITRRRWQSRGQDFYPVWSRIYPGGGTSCTALSQLIRWCAGKPVLPISTWRHWAGDNVKLLTQAVVADLLASGYPESVKCVLCKQTIEGGLDWWSLDKVSGPCCGWTSGCRQKPVGVATYKLEAV